MHLAFLITNMLGGGAERVQIELIRGLLQRGHRIDLVLLQARGDLLPVVPPGARVVELGATHALPAIPLIRRYLTLERPQVLFASLWPLTIAAIIAGLGVGSTKVVTVDHNRLDHQYANRPWRMRAMRAAMRLCYGRAAARVGVSRGVADEIGRIAGIDPGRVDAIYNPVPRPTSSPLATGAESLWRPGSAARILTVGNLKTQKNHALLLRAFRRLLDGRPAQLAIVGGGGEEARLRADAEALALTDDVRFTGFVLDPGPWYETADLFVLSSDYEGFGNVIVEAMHYGLPIVSTDCESGPAEILENGRFGRLVPPGDVDALAQAISEALDAPADRERQRQRAEVFSVSRAVDDYEALAKRLAPADV